MRIAVLTGGGDCPGLNGAIRAVVRKCLALNYEVVGVKRGWLGLMKGDVEPMGAHSVSGILPLGGTILGTSRTNPFKEADGLARIEATLRDYRVDALIAIGGDDTLGVANALCKHGILTVGVPKTMDNDVALTDYCIGFDSAVSIVTDALDKLHTTASSHHRVMVVEVMGRDSGWVALVGGLAGGADWIMIPEVPASVEEACEHLRNRRGKGKDFSIIVVAEGVTPIDLSVTDDTSVDAFGHVRLDRRGVGEALGRRIEEITGFETRVTVLGHLQRGGSPTVFDRMLATRLGVAAVDCVKERKFGKMVALQCSQIATVELDDVISQSPRNVDPSLYELAAIFY
ncbi:MAG: 6-phosphofructokinase [Armatimonadetes bacterium]|nr:6-phosphofructokinase [Armatimonadota bacterium]